MKKPLNKSTLYHFIYRRLIKMNIKRISYIVSILIITILVISLVVAANADKEVKIFKPSKINKNIKAANEIHKRVIAQGLTNEDVRLLKNSGCLRKHRLKHSDSFDCPEKVISKLKARLKVREARIFHIVDLKADQQIKADQVWAEGIDGEGVNVVILDTGVDSTHIELSDSILGCENFVTGENCDDLNGHGTHVAGIITANGIYEIDNNYATGVSPGAGIYMLKVCDSSGSCSEDDMMAAMEYATGLDAKIMSISIGGGNFGSHCDSDPLAAKVNWVVDNGFTVVVAAGNEGLGVGSPACASKAIAVGVVDKNDIVPYWSNRGTALDIVAPGVDILSTYSCLAAGDCGSYWYAYMDGSSMSTPIVAGVVSLLRETDTTLTDDGIKDALYTTATPANRCYRCTRWSWNGCRRQRRTTCTAEIQGAGIVDAYEAYLAVKPAVQQDTDGDGVPDSTDNCPDVVNPDQSDIDDDGIGDVCDSCTDVDTDGYCSEIDDCNDNDININPGETEICNGVDDNCNGITDDNSTIYTGTDVGECQQGIFECIYGNTTETQPEIGPSLEICDNLDNDCDGTIDQNTQQCGTTDIGACEYGTQTCTDGVWGSCLGEIGPAAETCNGLDDDCDGVLPSDETDADLDGYMVCEGDCDGNNTAVNPGASDADCNGIDNDCDGPADDDYVSYATECGVGACADNGILECIGGSEADSCTPGTPTAEVCNGIDDDCDGSVDEGVCDTQTKCWSAEYTYLIRGRSSFRKFCKCAEGNYGYQRYSRISGRATAYRYLDTGNNENWETAPISNYKRPAYRVRCSDGNWYNTNEDHLI